MSSRDVVTRFKQSKKNELTKFEPRKSKIRLGGLKAAIAQARKLEDQDIFRKAVAAYVDEQRRFVVWWDANVQSAGGDQKSEGSLLKKRNNDRVTVADAEAQTGITKFQVSRWRALLKQADAYIEALTHKLWKAAWARRDREQMHAEDEQRVASLVPLKGKFRTLVIDPPWDYDWLSVAGRAKPGYATMTHEDLLALDVGQWSDDECHLYLWTTNNFLLRACELVKAWEFDYKTMLTWVKPRWGLGEYFRNQSEHVLFATRGDFRTRADDISTIFDGDMGKHSEKPESFYELVRKASHQPYGEAFQRIERHDFTNLFVEG